MNKVYSRIESITGSVITVRAEGVKYNELADKMAKRGSETVSPLPKLIKSTVM